MAATRVLLLLFTSAFLFFSLYKLTPLSETITRQDFQDFIDALTIFKSNQFEPKFPDPEISTITDLYSYDDGTVVVSVAEVLDETQGWPVIDENDVVVLTGKNFSEFVDKNRYVMVMFHAPWCYWSRKLAPNFEAAAQLLKGETNEAVLAMVDASAERRLGAKYGIEAYPTMYLFVDGVKKYLYDHERTREAIGIATWVKSKMAEVLDETQGGPVIDKNNVVVLTGKNFSEFVDKNSYVMVMFYAPWCYWSQKLAPNFEAAAQLLKGETTEVVLAMVDANAETRLGAKYGIDAYPTMYLFVDGVKKYLYENERTREAIGIATWVKSKMAIGIHNLTTMEEAEHIFTSESELVLGVLDSLEGSDSEEFAAASKLQSDITFYQTASGNIAELFLPVPQVKRPALILMMPWKSYRFDGEFTRSAIADFVSTRKLPPVITFTYEDATSIFENPLKQLWLFAPRNASEVVCTFEEAAEAFRGKLLFVRVDLDKESIFKELAYKFGAKQDSPTVVAYNSSALKKHDVFGGELTLNNIKCFAEDFLKKELLKQSDPASETVLKLPSQSQASHQLHVHM